MKRRYPTDLAMPNGSASNSGGMAEVYPVQVQTFLGGIDYSATKEDLIKHAEQEGADENVRSTFIQSQRVSSRKLALLHPALHARLVVQVLLPEGNMIVAVS